MDDDPKQLSTTYETLSYLHWIRQMAPTEAEKTTRMRAKANIDPRKTWIWLMSDQKQLVVLQVWSQVVKFTKFIQWYSEHCWENLHKERHNIHVMLFRTYDYYYIAHLSLPLSNGWVALSFLIVRPSVRPAMVTSPLLLATDPQTHTFSESLW